MWPETTCAVHILAYTICTSLLLRFSFCFASLGQGRQYIFDFFVLLYTNLRFCFQIWPPCHRIGRRATDLAAVPQIQLPCHGFGRHATDLTAVPQIWPLCMVGCMQSEYFKGKGINHAFGVLRAGSQILFIAHIFSKFQRIKTLRRYSENMSWPDIVLKNVRSERIKIIFSALQNSKRKKF